MLRYKTELGTKNALGAFQSDSKNSFALGKMWPGKKEFINVNEVSKCSDKF